MKDILHTTRKEIAACMSHAHLIARRDDMCSLAETYMSQRGTSDEDEDPGI